MSEPGQIRVGIIGAGGIVQVSHIPNLRLLDSVDIVAISDSDIGRAALVADRYKIPNWFEDPIRMMNQSDLDCVIITTPTITHYPLCQTAFESGVDVLIEKPFARNIEEAQKIVDLADSNKRIAMVGMNHRFREDTNILKEIIEKELLGDIFLITSGWLKRLGVWGRPYWFTDPKLAGGGVLMDLGLQMIDIVLWLLDFPTVVESSCGMSNKMLELEVEDTATAFLRFDNEATFLLEVSWANCFKKDIAFTHIRGSQGAASLNPLNLNLRQGDRITTQNVPVTSDEMKLFHKSFQSEIHHFIKCVKSRVEPVSSARSTLSSLAIVDNLYKQAK